MNCGNSDAEAPCLSPAPDSTNDVAIDALLDHIARYRLTVFAALQRLPAFSAWRRRPSASC